MATKKMDVPLVIERVLAAKQGEVIGELIDIVVALHERLLGVAEAGVAADADNDCVVVSSHRALQELRGTSGG